MNNDKVPCGAFGFYPSFVAAVLGYAEGIKFCSLQLQAEILRLYWKINFMPAMQYFLYRVWGKLL
jgi:hypothetical protein